MPEIDLFRFCQQVPYLGKQYDVGGWRGGRGSRLFLFETPAQVVYTLTIKKIIHARMIKFNRTVMKLP